MKVLHIQKVTGIGGSERHLLTLLPALSERGVEVQMCILGDGDHHRFEKLAEAAEVEYLTLPAGRDLDPRTVGRIHGVIRRVNPDIVHTHLIHADLYGQIAAAIGRVPGIVSFHSTNPFFRKVPYKSAARLSGRLSKRTIGISEHVLRFVDELHLASPDRTRLIHYGIDASDWVSTDDEREAFRKDLGAREADVLVGVASRHFPNKGHDLLIEAFADVVRHVPEARLLIAGDGPLRAGLTELARRQLPEGAVSFCGYVDDVRAFMTACDVMIFPTLPGFGEGFGLAALEAMCAARPVVATELDSLPEIVQDGVTGMLVPPGDRSLLAEAISRLGSDRAMRIEMGDEARRRAVSDFSLKKMVDKTIDVYAEVLGT
jgi:glycosyltransferase involved in cell wall biosynthesis